MKRQGYLFEKIRELDNIKTAILRGSRGKRKRKQVAYCLEHLDDCALSIQKLIDGGYVPQKGRKLLITDGPKPRTIYVPKFYPDHIIEWAVLLQIQPILSRGMYAYSCSSIPGRGNSGAKKYVQRCLRDRKNTKYCLKADGHHYYDSIRHDCLMADLRRVVKDQRLLAWLEEILSGYGEGLPIGHILSQWLANFYFQGLDHLIKENLGVKYYVRNMDDIVLLGSNKHKLHKVRADISRYLADRGIVLNNNWQVFRVDDRGIDFVGYRFFHHKTILRRRNMLKFSRKVRRVYKTKRYSAHNAASIVCRLGQLRGTNCYGWYQAWIKPYINVKKLKGVISRANRQRISSARPV